MLLAFQRPASFAGSRTSGEQSALHHKQTCPRISMPRKAKVRQFNGRRLCIFGRPREPQQFRLDPSSGEQPVMLLYGPHPLDLRRTLPVIGGLGGVERRASRHCCSSSHIVSFVETIQCRASARYCLPWAQLQKILFGCFCHQSLNLISDHERAESAAKQHAKGTANRVVVMSLVARWPSESVQQAEGVTIDFYRADGEASTLAVAISFLNGGTVRVFHRQESYYKFHPPRRYRVTVFWPLGLGLEPATEKVPVPGGQAC
jgi:hypothetical protein